MSVGTPVILIDFISRRFELSYEGFLITVREQETLARRIEELINEKNFYNEYREKIKHLSKINEY